MAIFTKSELAYALGMGRSAVTNWLSRENIFADANGLINDQDPRNVKWIEGKLKKQGGNYKPPQEIKETRKAVNKKQLEPKVPKVKKVVNTNSDDLDDQKKKAEIQYKLRQIEVLELKAAQLKGENVPTKMVENVFVMLGKSFQTQYRDSSENLLGKLAHECKIGNKLHSKYKNEFIEMINKAHSDVIRLVKKDLKAIVSNTSGKIIMEDDG